MIRGVLLDSGGTLIGPRGGRWWPRPGFCEVLERELPSIDLSRFDRANEVALEWLEDNHPLATTDFALAHRRERTYFSLILEGMDVEPTDDLLDRLFEGDGLPTVEVFADTRPVLMELRRRGVKVAIVTDNGPAIRAFYDQNDLSQFVDAWAISAEVGCTKPDQRMYEQAVRDLGLPHDELLFVDDDLECVLGAARLGIAAAQIDRSDGAAHTSDVLVIRSLLEVLDLIDRSDYGQRSEQT